MNLLLDTHLLLWIAIAPERLTKPARALISDVDNTLWFSAASIWEVALKAGLGRSDFDVDPRVLRRGLIDNGYIEIPVRSDHAVAIGLLPGLHNDPFDRVLLAQAHVEGLTLLTCDAVLASYPGPVRLI
jgi:PIN domain nuclease of toxin-antitoxin system